MSIKDKTEAHNPEFLSRIERTHAVFFTGGDQFRLATILGGTPVADIIKERYLHDKNFLIAGTSAGAMVLSAVMKHISPVASQHINTSGLYEFSEAHREFLIKFFDGFFICPLINVIRIEG